MLLPYVYTQLRSASVKTEYIVKTKVVGGVFEEHDRYDEESSELESEG
jgi:hypothetical protein